MGPPRCRFYGRVRALILDVVLALAVTACAEGHGGSDECDVSLKIQVENTPSLRTCAALTGLDLGVRLTNKRDLDPMCETFCSSPACLDVFRQLRSLGGLACLAPHSTEAFQLDTEAGGVACFGAEAIAPPTPPLTAPTAPSPTPTSLEPAATLTGHEVRDHTVVPPQASFMTNASAGSKNAMTRTPQVDSDREAHTNGQTSRPSIVNTVGVSPTRSAIPGSVIFWLLVVTSSFMAVVIGLACFVAYCRSTRRAWSPSIKKAPSPHDKRPASKTRELSAESESPIASV